MRQIVRDRLDVAKKGGLSSSDSVKAVKKEFTSPLQRTWYTGTRTERLTPDNPTDVTESVNYPALRANVVIQIAQDGMAMPESGKTDPNFSFASVYGEDWYNCNCGRKSSECRDLWSKDGVVEAWSPSPDVLGMKDVCRENVMMRCEDHIEEMWGDTEWVVGACRLVSLSEIAQNCATRKDDVKNKVSFHEVEEAVTQYSEDGNKIPLKGGAQLAKRAQANTENMHWGGQQKERYKWQLAVPVGAIDSCWQDDANCKLPSGNNLEESIHEFAWVYANNGCCKEMQNWFNDVSAIYELSSANEADIVYSIRLDADKNGSKEESK